jgi:hypothetical protein
MTTKTRTALVLCSAGVLALAGCKNNGTSTAPASEAATKAMASLPQSVTNMAKDYIAKLGDMNSMLAAIHDKAAALKAIPRLAPVADSVTKLSEQLSALSPAVKDQTKTALGDQIATANDTFTSQASRLSSMPEIGDLLKPVFDRVKLFK